MIYGERIRFRAVEPADLSIFFKWFNDPQVVQGLSIYMPGSMVDEQEWYDGVRKRPPAERNLVIEVRQPQQGDGELAWMMIGGLGFSNIDRLNRCTELGITIGDKNFWGHGYGTEAVRLLVKHGFNTLNLNRIFLRVLENNLRAIRAYEKAGFTLEGRQRQAWYRDGRYYDLLVMSILKEEFKG